MLKRCWSFVLCFCLVLTLIPVSSAADADGYGVSGIVMDGSLVEVTYFCADKACLVVAVYDKQTSQMTAVGSKEVVPDKKMALISLSGTMPDFYIVSAFLLDSETYAPLCDKYTSTLYAQPIPDGATLFNGHAYKFYDQSMPWNEAKACCESMGGHLATVTSAEEQDILSNMVKPGTFGDYWLGGNDLLSEGVWQWVTGEDWSYQNWADGEPNNSSGAEDCLHLYRQSGLWNDLNNNAYTGRQIGFICEWDTLSLNPQYSSHPNLIHNWDFSSNSNGQATYINTWNNPYVESVDDWHPTPGKVEVLANGVRFSFYDSDTTAYFAYLMPESELKPLTGKTLTFSVIVDNVLYISTGVLEPGVIHSSLGKETPWGYFRIHHYQSTMWDSQYAPTFDLFPDRASSIVISAVKLEEGSISTLLLDL